MAEEELLVLAEIFCFPGELVHWRTKDFIHVNVNISEPCTQAGSHEVLLHFLLSSDYPTSAVSEINVTSSSSSSLPADFINQTKENLQIRAAAHTGEPMLLELIELAKESIDSLHNRADPCQWSVNPSIQRKEDPSKSEEIQPSPDPVSTEKKQTECTPPLRQENLWITLIQLDHMRSKSKYTKIIKNWCKNYNLSGRLIFCQKLILILLFGDQENLKTYLLQHKTACVDVDSRGRSCKERMMTVLTEEPYPEANKNIGFSNFQIMECSCMDEVENIFKSVGLFPLYKKHIKE